MAKQSEAGGDTPDPAVVDGVTVKFLAAHEHNGVLMLPGMRRNVRPEEGELLVGLGVAALVESLIEG